jgi:hypothetical protein
MKKVSAVGKPQKIEGLAPTVNGTQLAIPGKISSHKTPSHHPENSPTNFSI